ncbi:protein kinase domain-containing protein [Streptomyces lomondensis]|uniref:serine/threonine-protein kinase n=1 Tax=Streptomyces lomondensis TaxID=68229 RepID=UPI001E625D38|nr:PQQ-binding-like beta-propeller repeat protein [Streptomyces lomondensis]MCF0079783.1 serine/threonine-protein kinase [Streptomyces lomondensis]
MSWLDEKTPSVVGEYRIERRIGAGGMGVVYLAMSPSGRRVALKVIRGELADDADYRARFRQEIEAARQVSGAFTAPVLGADADADPPWMATQYFDAPTLSERVRKNGAFGEDVVWRLGAGLAEALRDIHRAGLVHRDLKPSNVLLTEDGPRVIDFGIARVLSAERLTRTGRILGTVSFMAPEQLSTPREVGAAADVFALGGVLTYAATGRGPFDGDTAAPPIAVAMKIAQDNPDLAGVPAALRPVIEKCLRKDATGRPSTAELLALLQEKGVETAKPEKPEKMAVPEGFANGPRRRPRTRTYLLAAAAAIAATVVVPVMQWRDAGGPRGDASPSAKPSSTQAARAVEPAAALRPKGWALWEKKPTTKAGRRGEGLEDLPSCAGTGNVLVCTEVDVVAERVDVSSGRVIWSKRYTGPSLQAGSVVGFTGKTVLVNDNRIDGTGKEQLKAFDVNTGDLLWSSRVSGPSFSMQRATVTMAHLDGHATRIDRRDARTGRLVASRTFPAGANYQVFGSESGALYLLKYGQEGFITSVADLDAATLRTRKVLASFDEDPGMPLTADNSSVSLLLDGHSVTRVTRADGNTERILLRGALEGTARAQGNTLYLSRANGTLASYNLRTGRRNWTVETESESPARPVLAGGRLYSLASDGRITCLDAATGQTVWRSAARRDPNTSAVRFQTRHPEPVVLHDVVYAGSTTGSIFAVAPPSK